MTMILKLRLSPDNLGILRRAAAIRRIKVRRFLREIALNEAGRQLSGSDVPTYDELHETLAGLQEHVAVVEMELAKAAADAAGMPEDVQIEVHDSEASTAAKDLVARAGARSTPVLADPESERRAEVLAVAVAELGKQGTKLDGHGGPEIEHIVRADDNEYHRYWIVLTAEGKRQIERLNPTIKNWGAKVLALVELEDLGAGPYLAAPEDWCAMFVTWAIGQIYAPGQWWDWKRPGHVLEDHPFGRWFGGVTQTREWAEAEGVYLEAAGTSAAPVGAAFIMPGDTHVGFVLEDLGRGRFKTIEGNLSDEVKSVERKIEDCAGFVLWWAAT